MVSNFYCLGKHANNRSFLNYIIIFCVREAAFTGFKEGIGWCGLSHSVVTMINVRVSNGTLGIAMHEGRK